MPDGITAAIITMRGQGEFDRYIRWVIFVCVGLGFVLGLFCLI